MVYVISDIHGALDAFLKMLKKIDFKFDKTDTLYILGDMVDWNNDAYKTLKYVMELEEKYEFVHVLIGNHEKMMLDSLLVNSDAKFLAKEYLVNEFYQKMDMNWRFNHGMVTYKEFLKDSFENQKKVLNYLAKLPYYFLTEVNKQKYYLAHAAPKPQAKFEERYMSDKDFMVWYRNDRYSFLEVAGDEYKDYIFIHGHTITSYYNSYNENHELIIYKDKFGIDIDCGAKGIYMDRQYGLSCLRLDDMQEYYIR